MNLKYLSCILTAFRSTGVFIEIEGGKSWLVDANSPA